MKNLLLPLLLIGILGIIAASYLMIKNNSYSAGAASLVSSICCFGGYFYEKQRLKSKVKEKQETE